MSELDQAAILTTKRCDTVLLVTLNHPEKRNAFDWDLIAALRAVIAKAETDATLTVVVITGAGTAFSSGLNLRLLLKSTARQKAAYIGTFFALLKQIYNLPQPVIAAVNGPAIAGGFDLAMFCDLRVCSTSAIFAQTEVLLGMTQIMHPLYEIIGLGNAKMLALCAEPISAAEAYRIGLVNWICRPEVLIDETMRRAATLAARPKGALFETKRLSRELIDLDTDSAMKRMLEAIRKTFETAEHIQAIERYADTRAK